MKTKVRVLHIDDNVHDRILVKDALLKESDHFVVIEADNRQKFEEHLSKGDFDLVLSDFNILGFDGLQVLQIVKEKDPEMPVIIVTGTGSEEIAIEAMKMGAADYVIKSASHIGGLAPTIDIVLNHKKEREERKLVEDRLCDSEKRYRRLFETAKDGIMILDADTGTIEDVNPFFQEMFGYSSNELIGNLFWNVKSFSKIATCKNAFLEIQNKDYLRISDVVLETKNGKKIIVELNNSLYLVDKKRVIQCNLRDITERKKTEEQLIAAKEKAEESDRLKTAFLHNISHEIRTPLNAIVGFSRCLNNPNLLLEKRINFTNIIIDSSNQLLSIISDLINIATIESGQERLQESEFNINSLIRSLHSQFSMKAEKQNIAFNYNISLPNDAATIVTDSVKLTEIINNLIGNAFKFTNRGHISFGYNVKGSYLEFYIDDTGIGIDKSMHEEIFKRFRQVENDTVRRFGGSGLGLSISKAYVELLGGKIWVDSHLGKGSIFYFTIPYKKAVVDEIALSNALKLKIQANKVVLVAEDEDSNFSLIEELLADLNLTLVRAVNGLEAVDMCKSDQQFDLVLMDVKMPVLDGYEATKQIKQIRPELSIIAQTAYSSDWDKCKALASGCVDFISKPIDQELLLAKIAEQLK